MRIPVRIMWSLVAALFLTACSITPPPDPTALPVEAPAAPTNASPSPVADASPSPIANASPSPTANASPSPTANASPSPTANVPPELLALAKQDLNRRTGVPLAAIRLVSAQAVKWPDSCLGIAAPGIRCKKVIVPGYRLVLAAGGRQYTYHTNAPPDWWGGKQVLYVG